MALVVKDRIKETTATTGTGTLTLAGAVTKFQSFSVVGDGNTTYYAIESGNGSDWEIGVGTYTASGTTLSRDTILESSNAGSAINLSGTSTVFCTYPAERSVNTADIGSTIQAYDATILKSADIGTSVQGYDADTAKYDDTTANFTGTLQNGGSNVVVDTDIGSTVQAYDADTAKYDDVTANFTGTLQQGGSNVLTGNQTITLSGDATGSGTTAITVTVVDDSHNHIISNVDGLQTALDGKQPLDADLTAIGGLANTDGNFIVGNGTTWVAESGATARTSLGLGSIATQESSNVTITGGSITGITDLTVADGGTGASSITANSVILGNGTSALSGNLVAPGTSGNVLTSNGTTWTSGAVPAPASLSTASGSAPSYSARAWVTYNAQTNTILANGNVSSVTDHATGQFTVNFATAMPDVNYAACGIVGQNDSTAGNHILCEYSTSRTTSSARVVSGTAGNTETDEPYWTYIAFR